MITHSQKNHNELAFAWKSTPTNPQCRSEISINHLFLTLKASGTIILLFTIVKFMAFKILLINKINLLRSLMIVELLSLMDKDGFDFWIDKFFNITLFTVSLNILYQGHVVEKIIKWKIKPREELVNLKIAKVKKRRSKKNNTQRSIHRWLKA